MSRDVAIQASAKLSGDWSAPEYAKNLSKEVMQELLPRYPKLDPLVRMRLLLSIMSLPAEVKSSMHQELEVTPVPDPEAKYPMLCYCHPERSHLRKNPDADSLGRLGLLSFSFQIRKS